VVTALLSTATAEAAQLALAWNDNSSDEAGFLVERRLSTQSTFAQVASLAANVTGFLDDNLPAGSTYCYRVRAFNAAGISAYTNEGCGTAGAPTTVALSVGLNQTSFTRADTMVATVNAVAGVVPSAIDAYIVIQVGGGGFLSLQLNGGLVPGLVPIARGVVLPTVSAPFSFPLAGAPPGNYVWIAGVTSPGSLTLVAPLASTPFSITP
jgi:hypothetical protein